MNSVLLLLLSIPLIEIYLFIKVGSYIGAFNTISLILITAVVGVAYARYEGFNTLKSGISQLARNELPISEMFSKDELAPCAATKALSRSWSLSLNTISWEQNNKKL